MKLNPKPLLLILLAAASAAWAARYGTRVLAGSGRLGVAIARYGAAPAAVYLMFRYPSLINATLTELGGWLGVRPWLVQFVFWFVALSVGLRFVLFLLTPLSRVLLGLGRVTGTLAAWSRPTPARRLESQLI